MCCTLSIVCAQDGSGDDKSGTCSSKAKLTSKARPCCFVSPMSEHCRGGKFLTLLMQPARSHSFLAWLQPTGCLPAFYSVSKNQLVVSIATSGNSTVS
eukprot:5099466-Amphidinium_carterae.1